MHISWARLASFCHLGFISDPQIVAKFHNETHDPNPIPGATVDMLIDKIQIFDLKCFSNIVVAGDDCANASSDRL